MSNTNATSYTTVEKVIASHYFTRGVKDFIAGKGFDKDYDNWPYTVKAGVAAQFDYERGRQFAAATEGKVRTKTGVGNKRVNYRAVSIFSALVLEGAIS